MVVQTKLMPVTNGSFPDENADPRVKRGKDWMIQFFRAALGTYMALPARTVGYLSRNRYDLLRKYALARQPFQPYRDMMEFEVEHNALPFLNKLVVSERIPPVMVKPRNIVVSLIEKANENYDIQLDPIDNQAAAETLAVGNEMKAKVLLRQTLERAGQPGMAQAAPIMKTPGEPDDLEGAHIAVMGIRHKAAIKAELLVSSLFSYNKYEQKRTDIAADLTDYGASYMRDDTSGCMAIMRKGDMSRLIVSPFSDPQGEDIWYAGELIDMPLHKLIADSNGYITEEQLKAVYDLASGKQRQEIFGTGSNWSWTRTIGQGRVQVLDMEFISTDVDTREERINQYGNPVFGKADHGAQDKEGVKIHRKRVQNVYTGKWVVGTDILYRFGPQPNQKLDPKNPSRVMLGFHFAFGHMENMDAYSVTENMIPFADSIVMRRIKLEHMFNTAIPKGFQINLSALEEIAIDSAGKQKLSPKDIMGLLFTRGIVLYRGESLMDDQGKMMDLPIKETVTTIGEEMTQYFNAIQSEYAMMMDTVGLNETTDATSPDAKRTNPATAAAMNGTKNALAKLFSAEKNMTISLAQGGLIRGQMLMKAGKTEEFVSALGSSTVAFLKGAPALDAYRFGYKIVDRPSQEQLQQFDAELADAVSKGFLDVGDVAYVRSLRNLKQQTEFLVYKCGKNKEEAKQFELTKIKQTTDQQKESSLATEEAKRETFKIEYSLKAELAKLEADLEFRNKKQDGLFLLEGKRIDATGRTDSAYVQAKGRDATNIRDNQTALLKEDKDEKAPQINVPAELKTDIAPQATAQDPLMPGVEELDNQAFSFLGKPLGDTAANAAPAPSGPDAAGPDGAEMPAPGAEQQPQEEATEDPAMQDSEAAEGEPQEEGAPAAAGGPSEQAIMQMLAGGQG